MIEKSSKKDSQRTTDLSVRPGDYILGSEKSRAAARALLLEKYRPIPPPWGTLNLSFLDVERARELYEKISALPGAQMLGTPWFPIRWPDGFKPADRPTVKELRANALNLTR
jgi:hypothetical protein